MGAVAHEVAPFAWPGQAESRPHPVGEVGVQGVEVACVEAGVAYSDHLAQAGQAVVRADNIRVHK